jgi:thymidylate synthase (FAD)
MTEIDVLDHGFVRLESSMGDDRTIVNSARVSFGKRTEVMTEADEKLINYLMKNRHGTPFEHVVFCFHVKAPIFVFREWQRHRIGSFNEMSARYMELPAEWYIPYTKNVRKRVGKPGHYTYELAPKDTAQFFIESLDSACYDCYESYKRFISSGIAPEQARMFLHVNHYSEMYWTVNARSLMNFLSLRNHETAQWEIRQYAEVVEEIFTDVIPITAWSFQHNERKAP